MNWEEINKEKENNKVLLTSSVGKCAIKKHPNHSHFWVEDQELYESYQTIRGMRYQHRFTVAGLKDTEHCSDAMILYISKEFC